MRRTELTETGLYIEPCTLCSLACRLCYTAHHRQRLLDPALIFHTVEVMLEGQSQLGVFWCGLGELYQDRRFPGLVAELDRRWGDRLLQTVHSNGQANAEPLSRPHDKFFLVSMDLPQAFCDDHRGRGYYRRAVRFLCTQLEAGAIGALIKCIITRETVAAIAPAFEQLLDELAVGLGWSRQRVAQKVELEPVLPFDRAHLLAVQHNQPGVATVLPTDYRVDRSALAQEVAQHLPQHAAYLADRPRLLEVALTVDGVFNCREAVEQIATHEELPRLDRAALLARLRASAPRCLGCGLAEVC